MGVKTVAVFLTFQIGDQLPQTSCEVGTFGKGEAYKTAKDFIDAVQEMHRSAKSVMTITNIVIG